MAKKKEKAGKVLTNDAISKKYKGCGLASTVAVMPDDAIWIPSRYIELNYTTGGGIPYGKILELFGEESSGKSLLAIDYAVVTQKLGGIVLWADAEHAFDARWAIANGLDLDRIMVYPETAVENLSDWSADMAVTCRSRLTDNEPILMVTDSLAALDCLANIDSVQADAKAEMGNRAKAIYKWLRIRNELYSDLGITSIYINQLRKKVGAGMFEDPDTTPGGGAMKFYASIRVGVYGGKQIKEKVNGFEDRVGRMVSVRIKKNKVAPPRPTIKAKMFNNAEYCTPGFSKYEGLPDLLVKLGVIFKKKGSSVYKDADDNKLATGEKNMIKLLTKNSKLRASLIKEAGINTVSQTRKQLSKITENRYPVTIKKIKSQNDEDDDE